MEHQVNSRITKEMVSDLNIDVVQLLEDILGEELNKSIHTNMRFLKLKEILKKI